VIHEFVLGGVSKQNISDQGAFDGAYEMSRASCLEIQFLRNATAIALQKLKIFFRKSALSERISQFGRPCRGLSTWTGVSPPRTDYI